MSLELHTNDTLSNKLLAATSGPHTTTLMDLPNELLTSIVKLIGPPDLSRCDPGWLVVPAICRRLLEVMEKISACSESGEIVGPDGNAQKIYGWWTREKYRQVDQAAGTPDRTFWIYDRSRGRELRFGLVYNGGNMKYSDAYLRVYGGYESTVQAIDRYLGGSPLHTLPRPNLTWLSKLELSVDWRLVDQENFSFTRVPCIVAPALQELRLSRYVVDWRCNSLRCLNIIMNAPMAGGPLVNYCYPPSQLFARLLDSRLTLEQVELLGCLPTVPEDHPHCGRVPVDDFPSLRKFMIAANPHEAGWLCARIGFPITCPPFIQTERGSAMDTLRSIACLYTHSVHDPKPALPGSHGELDALTFRTGGRHEDRCIVTASSITGSYMPPTLYDPTFGPELYAQCHTERYTYYESGCPVDVRELDTQVPGIEPKFATTLGWDLDAWNDLPPSDDLRGAQCSALHGIRHVFIEGWLIETDSDAQVWTAVLRHLPNVRSLYINAPSPASLAPLINEPNLISALRTLWLGYDKDTKADWGFGPRPQYCKSLRQLQSRGRKIDAKLLRDILDQRPQSLNRSAPDLKIKLVNLKLAGDIDSPQVRYGSSKTR